MRCIPAPKRRSELLASITLAALGRALLDLLYPPRCSLCGRGGDFLCETCASQLPRAQGPRCERCWLPLFGERCPACRRRPLSLTRLRSALCYQGDVRRLVHAFKFGGQSCLAPRLGRFLVDCYSDNALEADVIVPVPLTGIRRRQRGYNQAALLAGELARATGLPVAEALRRQRYRGPQVAAPGAEQRRLNVERAFAVRRAETVRGQRLLVVDDVATTGATLDACARVLLAAGARDVQALTLARED